MTPIEISNHLCTHFVHVRPKASWGETSFFVNPGSRLPSGSYFATVKEKDGEHDSASGLDRPGIFRLNFGPGKPAFVARFGNPPPRPPKGGIVAGPWEFTRTDILMPHPVYGWMGWMCVLNPSKDMFLSLLPLLEAAHARALASATTKLEKLG